jgi:predicted nucleotidyltransferase
MTTNNLVYKQILKNSQDIIPGCKVLLFGSRARNLNAENSDYDLLLISKTNYTLVEKMALKAKLRKIFAKIKIDADVLIESDSELFIKKELKGHIINDIMKYAITL